MSPRRGESISSAATAETEAIRDAVPCSRCDAQPGRPCRYVTLTNPPREVVDGRPIIHTARRDAYTAHIISTAGRGAT